MAGDGISEALEDGLASLHPSVRNGVESGASSRPAALTLEVGSGAAPRGAAPRLASIAFGRWGPLQDAGAGDRLSALHSVLLEDGHVRSNRVVPNAT